MALGKRVATSYGQTETVGSITFTPADATREDLCATVGVPAAPYELRIADEAARALAQGVEGEIQVRSPFSMSGYWRAPAASAAACTPDGWLRTGDLGRQRQDGAVTLIGRASEVFKSGGYNIAPAEIENALLDCPGVAGVAVVSIPDDLYGSVGAAVVTPMAGSKISEARLRSALATRLANYKIPKQIAVANELPRLAVGKVDKDAVRRLLANPGRDRPRGPEA